MNKRTKALQFDNNTKAIIYERDNYHCIICGGAGAPNAHYIPRSQGGLGIEENGVTLCQHCHSLYDHSGEYREQIGTKIKAHLIHHYPYWCEDMLIYRKYED